MNIYSASLLSLLPAVQCLVSGLPSQQVPLTGVNGQNHLAIPHLGFGTWNLSPDDHNASAAVEHAIKTGYRHIDCAAAYNNQEDVGRGIARGLEAVGLRREDIWVTSKLWNDHHGSPEQVAAGLDKTISDLDVHYLDLYLMHWPVSSVDGNEIEYLKTWDSMVKLQALSDGRVKHIGVSNFSPAQLSKLIKESGVAPAVHQFELHPYLPQNDWILWHQAHGIHVTAYSPLGNMNPTYGSTSEDRPVPLLKNRQVQKIAERAGCAVSGVPLAWGLARGTSVIPKSQHEKYIEDNFKATKCDLSYEDLHELGEIGREWGYRFNNPSKGWKVPLYEGLEGV